MGTSLLRYIPVKYEKIREPTNDEPGLIKVYTIQEREDGTKEEVTEEFNTVGLYVFLSLSDFSFFFVPITIDAFFMLCEQTVVILSLGLDGNRA